MYVSHVCCDAFVLSILSAPPQQHFIKVFFGGWGGMNRDNVKCTAINPLSKICDSEMLNVRAFLSCTWQSGGEFMSVVGLTSTSPAGSLL